MTLQQTEFRRLAAARVMLLITIMVLGGNQMSPGQNANPQGPFGQPAAQPAVASPPQPNRSGVLPPREPLVVRLLRESNPTSPFELTRAAQLMVQTNHLKEAKQYLQQLATLKMTAEEKAHLQRDFGTGLFLQFARQPELQPEGAQISELVADAAYRLAQNPKRIAELIRKLSDPAPEVRRTAMEDLKPSSTAAVTALADLLGDESRTAELPAIRAALLQFRSIAHEPLIGYLESTNIQQKVEAINLLGQLGHARSIMYLAPLAVSGKQDSILRKSAQLALLRLAGAIPSQQETELFLQQQIDEFHKGSVPVAADADSFITLWQWNRKKNTSVPVRYRTDVATMVLAAQAARDLYSLDQQNRQYQLWYLANILAASKRLGGIDTPLAHPEGGAAQIASQAGPEVIHDVFQQSLENNRIAAAIASAEVLGAIGTPALVEADAGKRSPLVQALLHSNRRLRFTALDTILRLDPQKPFPGSSHVSDALGYFASSQGIRTAFVGHPLLGRGQFLTGLLDQAGYRAEKALVGKSLLELVRKQTDCDLVLISNTISSPTVGELIQRFRDDPRTASISIGILADPENLERARMLATMDPLTEVVGRPHNLENLAFYLARLEQHRSYHHVGIKERIAQARTALQWLDKLTVKSDQYGYYNLFRQEPAVIRAVSVPQLTQYAAPILGSLGTAHSQKALVNTASRNGLHLALRQSAARAFDRAVHTHRLMLTREDILRQYDRYNASSSLDKQTQKVLGSILDSVERRALVERAERTNKNNN